MHIAHPDVTDAVADYGCELWREEYAREAPDTAFSCRYPESPCILLFFHGTIS